MISTSSSQKKNLQSLLATNLKKLTITPPPPPNNDFDFAEVFGPLTPQHQQPNPTQSPSSTSSPSAFLGDPQVIHTRSHSYVGPSPPLFDPGFCKWRSSLLSPIPPGDFQPPFTHANRQKLQQRIIQEKVKLPPFLSTEAHSLLKGESRGKYVIEQSRSRVLRNRAM
ncbi:hypothetical protein QQP08_010063 [Theobroma cacao]|nr:hypothetical protein QQP08_010063 [Theobroma cacao]